MLKVETRQWEALAAMAVTVPGEEEPRRGELRPCRSEARHPDWRDVLLSVDGYRDAVAPEVELEPGVPAHSLEVELTDPAPERRVPPGVGDPQAVRRYMAQEGSESTAAVAQGS